MADYQPDQEREHEFDGIVEYDNRVPLWLQAFFHVTVVFAVAYLGYYWVGPGKMGAAEYEEERIQILRELTANMTELPDEATLRQLSHDQQRFATGQSLFMGKGGCVACHGADGLGVAGPNLRDDRWIHGSDMLQIIHTLEVGVIEQGMPSAAKALSRDEIISVACFLAEWNRSQKANGQGVQRTDREVDVPISY